MWAPMFPRPMGPDSIWMRPNRKWLTSIIVPITIRVAGKLPVLCQRNSQIL